jgi:hypothetical protein
VSVIAHELATPLTTLRGYAQMLTRPTVERALRERAKSILLSETGRMVRLVQISSVTPMRRAACRCAWNVATWCPLRATKWKWPRHDQIATRSSLTHPSTSKSGVTARASRKYLRTCWLTR